LTSPARPALSLPGPYAGVVMDMDGLLLETEAQWLQAKVLLFARHGVELTQADQLAVFGASDVATGRYFAQRFGAPPEEEVAIRTEYIDIACDMFRESVPVKPGALELVERLSGTIPLALASNTRRRVATIVLASTPFTGAFDAVITGDDGEAKPAPDLYLRACADLSVEPAESIALEDSPTGVAAAKAAGMTCIGVPSHPDERLAEADIVIDSLTELL
jgi:HAD superfamily hydrolase (TIGR01509 family)